MGNYTVGLLVWVGFSLLVGASAAQRGRSFAGYALLSLVLSPLLALIILLVMPNLSPSRRPIVSQEESDRILEARQPPRPDPLVALEQLAALRDRGAITEAEFEAKKAELLGRV